MDTQWVRELQVIAVRSEGSVEGSSSPSPEVCECRPKEMLPWGPVTSDRKPPMQPAGNKYPDWRDLSSSLLLGFPTCQTQQGARRQGEGCWPNISTSHAERGWKMPYCACKDSEASALKGPDWTALGHVLTPEPVG